MRYQHIFLNTPYHTSKSSCSKGGYIKDNSFQCKFQLQAKQDTVTVSEKKLGHYESVKLHKCE